MQKKVMKNPIGELKEELRRVTWPSRAEATELTAAVIIISLIVGLFVGIIDFSLAQILGFIS